MSQPIGVFDGGSTNIKINGKPINVGVVIFRVSEGVIISGVSMANKILSEVVSRGGEGLMLRDPELPYHPGRSAKLLKYKEDVNERHN